MSFAGRNSRFSPYQVGQQIVWVILIRSLIGHQLLYSFCLSIGLSRRFASLRRRLNGTLHYSASIQYYPPPSPVLIPMSLMTSLPCPRYPSLPLTPNISQVQRLLYSQFILFSISMNRAGFFPVIISWTRGTGTCCAILTKPGLNKDPSSSISFCH